MGVFGSVAAAIIPLITFRDALRARLREETGPGVSVLKDPTEMLAAYLLAERDLGRSAVDADVDTLALTLIGSGHLLFAGRDDGPPEPAAVRDVVATILAGVVREPR